ncbi:superfamily II DNA/RNA helicase, SNF2 family [Solibacillus silvestris StLB046]|uniref:Superfamily II DNA/RNA helicase, SNF2 family n=1 Tax=Solibacillus silvestris (strain StLB046) TaxID=1002809 RepID=F2F3X9_SOLSS|nr:DEAD/DEAH box helicase [Solibacillus silvestris]BAK17777.1 superfamily II DNA/RNA helicase, SNF2 family [Solibacillus silvestris StLB046]
MRLLRNDTMQYLFNTKLPFLQVFRLKLSELRPGYFRATAYNKNDLILPTANWIPSLFFKFEQSFYGLHTSLEERDLIISASHLLDVLSPAYRHPFLDFAAYDDETVNHFQAIQTTLPLWNDPKLWQQTTVTEEGFTFSNALLQHAVEQKLMDAGLSKEDTLALIPFFQNGGWPMQTSHVFDGVKVALRLSEPEENEENWLLETVLISPNAAKHWTPASSKLKLPILEALPKKWSAIANDIEELQNQIVDLIQLNAESAQFIHTQFNDQEVREFLRLELTKLQALGFDVILPAWLKELRQSKMRVRVSANNQSARSVAGLDDILTFKWQFSMNGEEISAEAFQKLVAEKREFIRIGTEWFRIDAEWLNEMRELMDQAKEENWTVRDLLFRELPETLTAPIEDDTEDDAERDDPLFAFEMQQSLQDYIDQLQNKKGLPKVAVPAKLHAELRPYQQEGFEWLVFMRDQKFGACLADDMGLGKTVQLITYMLHTVSVLQIDKPTLIVCPTSVVGNWQKELTRFAPDLEVYTHYGPRRLKGDDLTSYIATQRPHVILSTYGTVTQDADDLQLIDWATVALDEAQNIKNMQTLQSRAIRKLKGEHHIALTGTPVENRLSELWAIFDFIHKGYLGSFTRFTENFITPIEREESESHKRVLRMKIRPFLLRRSKRDPELQLNLPDKQESLEFCALTPEQAAHYEGYIQDTLATLEELTGFEKKGRILKMLNKLKQLCNHPALFLKEPFEDANTMVSRSVKLKRIIEMTKEIIDNGEQCLIFTQYIGMGNLIQHCLTELYNVEVPFLTGSMPKNQRDNLVDQFQAGEFPVFLLSLKAGGTGLNLTAATHVLHADRWWNPAVENQATDRAYRIGQTQFVQVHKFVTIGTIEEKIDKMIAMKSALSEELIQSSKWLTELDDSELMDLLILDTGNIK